MKYPHQWLVIRNKIKLSTRQILVKVLNSVINSQSLSIQLWIIWSALVSECVANAIGLSSPFTKLERTPAIPVVLASHASWSGNSELNGISTRSFSISVINLLNAPRHSFDHFNFAFLCNNLCNGVVIADTLKINLK